MSFQQNHLQKKAFTLIEMISVLGVIIILLSMTAGSVLPILRKNKVNEAAANIESIAQQARLLSLTGGSTSIRLSNWTVSGSSITLAPDDDGRYIRIGDGFTSNNGTSGTVTGVNPSARTISLSQSIPATTDGIVRVNFLHIGRFGVVIEQSTGGEAKISLTFGTEATPSTILLRDPALPISSVNPPIQQYVFNKNVSVWSAATSGSNPTWIPINGPEPTQTELNGYLGWLYQNRTGTPCIYQPLPYTAGSSTILTMISIGIGYDTTAITVSSPTTGVFEYRSPIADRLSVQSLDGKSRKAIRIFGNGMIDSPDF